MTRGESETSFKLSKLMSGEENKIELEFPQEKAKKFITEASGKLTIHINPLNPTIPKDEVEKMEKLKVEKVEKYLEQHKNIQFDENNKNIVDIKIVSLRDLPPKNLNLPLKEYNPLIKEISVPSLKSHCYFVASLEPLEDKEKGHSSPIFVSPSIQIFF